VRATIVEPRPLRITFGAHAGEFISRCGAPQADTDADVTCTRCLELEAADMRDIQALREAPYQPLPESTWGEPTEGYRAKGAKR